MPQAARIIALAFILLTIAVAAAQDGISPELQEQLDRIEHTVSRMRQLEPLEDTALAFLTREAYKAELTAQFEERASSQELADGLLFYRALDLAESDVDLEAILVDFPLAQVAGYYDRETREMNLILLSEQAAADELPILESIIYVHEFVHALQDQHYDLDAFTDAASESGNYDFQLAIRSLIEGDAEQIEFDYVVGLPEDDWQALLEAIHSIEVPAAPADIPDVMAAAFAFPYQQGPNFVAAVISKLGWEGVDRAFRENPPQTTEHIYHPESYLEGDAPNPVSIPDLSDIIGAGWRQVYDNPVGEFYLRQHLDILPNNPSDEIMATGWGGDRMRLFADDATGDLLWVWHQAWDSAKDATEFAVGYRDFLNQSYAIRSADGLCWTDLETRCFMQISETETRITSASDPKTALTLLLLES